MGGGTAKPALLGWTEAEEHCSLALSAHVDRSKSGLLRACVAHPWQQPPAC
jgi:hypothetical protein